MVKRRRRWGSLLTTTATTPSAHSWHTRFTDDESIESSSLLFAQDGLFQTVRRIRRSQPRETRNVYAQKRASATRTPVRAEGSVLNDSEEKRRLPAAPRGEIFGMSRRRARKVYGAPKKKPARREAPLRTAREGGWGASGEARERRRDPAYTAERAQTREEAEEEARRPRDEEEPLPRKVELVRYSLPMLSLSSSSSGHPPCASTSSPPRTKLPKHPA